jgi:hypothetical protein
VIVSLNKLNGSCYEFRAILFDIALQMIKPSPLLPRIAWFCSFGFILFYVWIILGSKENGPCFSFSASRSPLIRTSITNNLQIYINKVQCTHFHADAKCNGKECLITTKLIKDLGIIFIIKSYFAFCVLFILWAQ